MSRIDLRTSKLLGLALLLGSSSVFAQTVEVTPDDTMGWFETDLVPDATVKISDAGETIGAAGALEFFTDTSGDVVNASRLPLVNLDDITGIGYSYYTGSAVQAPVLKLQYWSVTEFGTLNWEANAGNPAPVPGGWVTVDGTTGVWWNTANGGTPANAQSLAAWQAELGNVLVQFLKVGVGSGWTGAGTMWADLVNLQTASSTTTWDFTTEDEPSLLPPVDPAGETALVRVIKIFNDGNDELPVTLSLSCTSGTIAPFDVVVNPVGNGSTSVAQHIFVVDLIPDGPPNVCTATESGTDGYDVTALCGGDGDPDDGCAVDQVEEDALGYCQFNDVQADDVAECILVNSPAPVDVDVHKVWEMAGNAQADVNQDVRITLICDGEIVGGTEAGNLWWTQQDLTIGGGDFDDEEGDYTGMGTATFEVIPDFYSTADDPKFQDYTTCYTKENMKDSYVELDNGCGDSLSEGTIMVSAGMGDECTMTNTVFFEGIPTLNQYGMAIMALLMLGVGFVGFRRFV